MSVTYSRSSFATFSTIDKALAGRRKRFRGPHVVRNWANAFLSNKDRSQNFFLRQLRVFACRKWSKLWCSCREGRTWMNRWAALIARNMPYFSWNYCWELCFKTGLTCSRLVSHRCCDRRIILRYFWWFSRISLLFLIKNSGFAKYLQPKSKWLLIFFLYINIAMLFCKLQHRASRFSKDATPISWCSR